jgi:hypothetical protein
VKRDTHRHLATRQTSAKSVEIVNSVYGVNPAGLHRSLLPPKGVVESSTENPLKHDVVLWISAGLSSGQNISELPEERDSTEEPCKQAAA